MAILARLLDPHVFGELNEDEVRRLQAVIHNELFNSPQLINAVEPKVQEALRAIQAQKTK